MKTLSQTEFGTLLNLSARASLNQKIDLQQFIIMEPAGQEFVIKLLNQAKITRPIKSNGESLIISQPEKKTRRGGKEARPLQIIAPLGCKMNEDIPFSIDHFDKWLNQKGYKATKTYSVGVNSMLKSVGMTNLKALTIFGMKAIRDTITSPSKLDMNKRTWLKKFNEYLVYEYENKK